MKIIVVGAEGDTGKASREELGTRYNTVKVGRAGSDVLGDMSDRVFVDEMYLKNLSTAALS